MQSTLPSVTVVVEFARRFVDAGPSTTSPAQDRVEQELNRHKSAAVLRVNKKLTKKRIWTLLATVKTKYILFIREGHDWSKELLTNLIDEANHTQQALIEPYTFTTSLPNNPEWAAQQLAYNYSRDVSVYGKLFEVSKLLDLPAQLQSVDKSTIYLIYRLYWRIDHTTPINEAYTTRNPTLNSNGLKLRSTNKTPLPLIDTESIDLRSGILRLLILGLRRLRQTSQASVNIRGLGVVARHYRLQNLLGHAQQHHPVEAQLLSWLSSPEHEEYLTKQLTEYDLYTRFSESPLSLEHPSARINTIRAHDTTVYVYREYRPKSLRTRSPSPEIYDFYSRRIRPDSTILIFDRPTAADDNAEHLYRYIKSEMPEYQNVFFALDSSSKDWNRLKAEDFRLTSFYSSEFFDIFLQSDVVISSQMYNLSRRGKDFTNSRFVYLQHGIQLNDMHSWLTSNHYDLIISTGNEETEYLKEVSPVETLNSGMPRLQQITRNAERTNTIVYMPTWNFDNHSLSQDDFSRTQSVQRVNDVLAEPRLLSYLDEQDVVLKVKLHPNLENRSEAFCFSERVLMSSESYQDLIGFSDFVFTDYSSAALDAAFARVPIAFYQPSSKDFYRGQIYHQRLNYREIKLGPVFQKLQSLVSYIVNEAYRFDRDFFEENTKQFFASVDRESICSSIMKKVLAL
ncbi:CDP-glycerol glycerophosphotransferase family protein [Brevibacterium sp. UCMA 11752]|uniref:CDP-glycerol glycerophosphotransferase family protein n=1 Tax=Brevibacterium sp. UCMA 11752 TaxID=2745946 RepID=UPI001F456076|nr:CDP-glycerol glycerophosphotransferase family protein [Brevibacterium sp. UCMA 11752]MCF2585811.1 CDP-glycerol glycerophosphotransferase family protein [Brevibacterium sp. UCMA 11752]